MAVQTQNGVYGSFSFVAVCFLVVIYAITGQAQETYLLDTAFSRSEAPFVVLDSDTTDHSYQYSETGPGSYMQSYILTWNSGIWWLGTMGQTVSGSTSSSVRTFSPTASQTAPWEALYGVFLSEKTFASQAPGTVNASLIYFDEVTDSAATVHWTAPSNGDYDWPIIGYRISMRSEHQSFFHELPGVYIDGSTQHSVTGLASGTLYYFKIAAYNFYGEGELSSASYALFTHAVPEIPDAPLIDSNTDVSVTITLAVPETLGSNDCDDITNKDLSSNICTTEGEGSRVLAYEIQVYEDSAWRTITQVNGSAITVVAECSDDLSTTDSQGDDCSEYGTVDTCGDYDDSDFDANEQCCVCGGGTTAATQTYTVEGLSANTAYQFRYRASNGIDYGDYSASSASVTTYDVPSQPDEIEYLIVADNSITITWNLPDDNGQTITGFRLFATSCDPLDVEDNCASNDGFSAAVRDDVDISTEDTTYSKFLLDSNLPSGMDGESWLEMFTVDSFDPSSDTSFVITNLVEDTYYKFRIIFQNSVGDSPVSGTSMKIQTLEEPITEVKAFSGPPCIYEDGSPTRFRAMADGKNTKYKWKLADTSYPDDHEGSVIAEGDTESCITDVTLGGDSDCSVMEYTFSHIGDHTIEVIAYNERGQLVTSTDYTVEYCGCMDMFDSNYWNHATFHVPMMCEHENWDGSDKTVSSNQKLDFQFLMTDATHDVEVTLRVDVGAVDLYISSGDDMVDIDMEWTYLKAYVDVSDWLTVTVPYKYLHGRESVVFAVVGNSDASFSRFELVAHRSDFTRGSEAIQRNILQAESATSVTQPTGYYDFFEYYFAEADNDMDVEIILSISSGCVSVFTSQYERFPSEMRITESDECAYDNSNCDYDGFWYSDAACSSSFSIMHTIKPEDSRVLYIGVVGTDDYTLGDVQADNDYSIEAKVYRYSISSTLIEAINQTYTEDYRYSTVSLDNFNYYELVLGEAGYAFELVIDVNFGDVAIYTSSSKLPSQDEHPYTSLDGENVAHRGYDQVNSSLGLGITTINISFDEISTDGRNIYVGVLGLSDDSSYTFTVNELSFDTSPIDICEFESARTGSCYIDADAQTNVILYEDEYQFYQVYVGPEDESMEITYRSGAGSETSNLGTDSASWGTDWTEPLTETWMLDHSDEHDFDVKLVVTSIDSISGELYLYASSTDPYPSEERGYDVKAQLSSDGELVLPHYTFSNKMAYFSLLTDESQSFSIQVTLEKTTVDTVSVDSAFDSIASCPGEVTELGVVTQVCNGQGSCVNGECQCNDGYLGDSCSIQSFSAEEGQPLITQVLTGDTDEPWSYTTFDDIPLVSPESSIPIDFTVTDYPYGSYVKVIVDGNPYPGIGADTIELFDDSCTEDSDSCDYSEGECVADNMCTACCASCASECGWDDQVVIHGALSPDAYHTIEILLFSNPDEGASELLYAIARQFQVDAFGGCSTDSVDTCSGNGVCQDGYCVCFDGYAGIDCSNQCSNADCSDQVSGTSAGEGQHRYKQNVEIQEAALNTYARSFAERATQAKLARSEVDANQGYEQGISSISSARTDLSGNIVDRKLDKTKSSDWLHRTRDNMKLKLAQMRQTSSRLQTSLTEDWIDVTRDMHDSHTTVQTTYDLAQRTFVENTAVVDDKVREKQEKSNFRLNKIRTANGPVKYISELEQTVCSQDQTFNVECTTVDVSSEFEEGAGYVSYGSGEWNGDTYVVDGEYIIGEYSDIPR